jgi:hypothetical protein
MLKANVGLSRKLSKDYQSTGFSVNLEGEITAPTSDAEVVIEQIKELFDLAEETLDQQISRSTDSGVIAPSDSVPPVAAAATNGQTQPATAPAPSAASAGEDPATDKQIKFLLAIGKRRRLAVAELDAQIAEVLGYSVGLYDLSKRQAGGVLDALTKNGQETAASRS